MNMRVRSWAALALAIFTLLWPVAAIADEGEDDNDVARELYAHGDIKSLEDILTKLKNDTPGDVVGIELLRVGSQWVYRFQVIAADGHRVIVDVDAGSTRTSAQEGDD